MSSSRRELLASCVRAGRDGAGPNAGYFPDVVLETHERRQVRFYDDLLAGGHAVFVHFMSVAGEAERPVVANLARVQPYLGHHLGSDVMLCSLSADPERDTPEALAALARRCGARPGWHFLTGAPADLEALRGALYAHAGPHHHRHEPSSGPRRDCSVGLARYGNESLGIWGSVPLGSSPDWIARRLSWVVPGRGGSRKAGPRQAGPRQAGLRQAGAFERRGPHAETYRT